MHHLDEQVEGLLVEIRAHLSDIFIIIDLPLGESHFELGQVVNALPGILSGGALDFEDFKNLPDFRVSQEKGPLVSHFVEDAAH